MKILTSPIAKAFFGVSLGVAVLGWTVGPDDTATATATAATAVGWGGGVTAGSAPKLIEGFRGGMSAADATDADWAVGAEQPDVKADAKAAADKEAAKVKKELAAEKKKRKAAEKAEAEAEAQLKKDKDK